MMLRFWKVFSAPWLAPVLAQPILCRALTGGALVIAGTHWLGYSLFPCAFAAITGLPCPGCGMTRAVTALLRGEWERSWALHPFAGGFLVLGVLLGFASVVPAKWREGLVRAVLAFEHRTRLPLLFLLATVIYGLLRMGGLCSNHAVVHPSPILSRHFGAGQGGDFK